MIMFFLPWWTYVLLGTVTFTCALLGQWLANLAQLGVEHDDGPFPCGEHLGTDEDGAEDWCWQLADHDGDHLGMRQDWSGLLLSTDGVTPLPNLPQRVSKVPVETGVQGSGYSAAQLLGQTEHNDPWPTCGDTPTGDWCYLAKGHQYEHKHI